MRLRVLRWALPSSILLGISLSGCPDRAPARPAVAPLAPSALASVAATPADAGAPTPPAAPAPTVKKLAASPGRTCALLASGEVSCWGGGLGPRDARGYRTSHTRPTRVPVRGAIDVAVGVDHACAALEDGRVSCWGSPGDGALGSEPEGGAEGPVLVPGLADVVEVASRAEHTCARRRDGRVTCWGKNESGQLGVANGQGPVEVPHVRDAAEIAVSHDRSCARRASGEVVCWGNVGPKVKRGGARALLGVADAARIALEVGRTCAVTRDGRVTCAADMDDSKTLADVAGASALALSAGFDCLLEKSGKIRCLGINVSGQLGDGTTADHHAFAAVADVTDAVQVVASWNHVCALRAAGAVVCWGANNEGQLGLGTDGSEREPHRLAARATQVIVGPEQSCAIGADRALRCWGHDVTRVPYAARSAIEPVPGLGPVQSASLGRGHGCAVLTSGRVACWGDPSALGASFPYRDDRAVAVIDGVADAQLVTTGERHTCVLRKNGHVACFGQNDGGELGDGTLTPSRAAVAVSGLVDAVAVSAGERHTCAVRRGGTAVCWGRNDAGQLGAFDDPRPPHATTPFTVPTLSGVSAVGAGASHTCAIAGGRVTCWGHDHQGRIVCQHPRGCFGPRFVALPNVVDATSLSVGGRRSCVSRPGGATTCWSNIHDQHTDAEDLALTVPLRAVAVETSHACALHVDEVLCWGRNEAGQVGAPPPFRTRPTPPAW